ncbi:MAG: hypothetical protein ACJ73E_02965, partial [Mycobacteriales bacterium]
MLLVLGLVPLVGAVVVGVLPRGRELLAKQLTLAFSLATLAVTIGLWVAFEPAAPERFQFTTSFEWIRSFGVSFALGVDGIALVLIALVAVLVPCVVLASWSDRDREIDAAAETALGGYAAGGRATAGATAVAASTPAGGPVGRTATAVLDRPAGRGSAGSTAGATPAGEGPGGA